MNLIEIAGGRVTVELEPEEAMDLARACDRVLNAPFNGDKAERDYQLYRALFEAAAVAAEGQYRIADKIEEEEATLTALRAAKR